MMKLNRYLKNLEAIYNKISSKQYVIEWNSLDDQDYYTHIM